MATGRRSPQPASGTRELDSKEPDVLIMLALGASQEQTAAILKMSPSTISRMLGQLRTYLECPDDPSLVTWVIEEGILSATSKDVPVRAGYLFGEFKRISAQLRSGLADHERKMLEASIAGYSLKEANRWRNRRNSPQAMIRLVDRLGIDRRQVGNPLLLIWSVAVSRRLVKLPERVQVFAQSVELEDGITITISGPPGSQRVLRDGRKPLYLRVPPGKQ